MLIVCCRGRCVSGAVVERVVVVVDCCYLLWLWSIFSFWFFCCRSGRMATHSSSPHTDIGVSVAAEPGVTAGCGGGELVVVVSMSILFLVRGKSLASRFAKARIVRSSDSLIFMSYWVDIAANVLLSPSWRFAFRVAFAFVDSVLNVSLIIAKLIDIFSSCSKDNKCNFTSISSACSASLVSSCLTVCPKVSILEPMVAFVMTSCFAISVAITAWMLSIIALSVFVLCFAGAWLTLNFCAISA